MKLINLLIDSKIYISLAAVFLTFETQIQLGMKPQIHPYIFIVFFATYLEYNFHRLITNLKNNSTITREKKQRYIKESLLFYLMFSFSCFGFIIFSFIAKLEVLQILAPLALLSIFYLFPSSKEKFIFNLRRIPYLKIFLITVVWSITTVLLPQIQSGNPVNDSDLMLLLSERFFFIFAITIPFDIRDIETDKISGLKTIPMLLNEKQSFVISYFSLLFFFIISFFHYQKIYNWFIIIPLTISSLTTFLFLYNKRIRKMKNYHSGILDGTMLLQGLLVLMFYYFLK